MGKNGTGASDDKRVSEQAWLNETDTEALARLTARSVLLIYCGGLELPGGLEFT